MSKIFQERIADRILRIVGGLLVQAVSDPRLQDLTVTKVVVDRELQFANVYVTSFDPEAEQKEVMAALRGASSFLRRELSQRLHTRTLPQLRFHWDPTSVYAAEVDALLDSLEIPALEEPEEDNDSTSV